MTIFLCVFIGAISLNLLVRMVNLSNGHVPETPIGWYAFGAIEYVGWIVWASILLATR